MSDDHEQSHAGRRVTIPAPVMRWADRLVLFVAFGALGVLAWVALTSLPASVTPPHYLPESPHYVSPFSSSALSVMPPIEAWLALAVMIVAVKVHGAIVQRSSTRSQSEPIRDTPTRPEDRP